MRYPLEAAWEASRQKAIKLKAVYLRACEEWETAEEENKEAFLALIGSEINHKEN